MRNLQLQALVLVFLLLLMMTMATTMTMTGASAEEVAVETQEEEEATIDEGEPSQQHQQEEEEEEDNPSTSSHNKKIETDFFVIGGGLGRTGTDSLRRALNQLGLGITYHMLEVVGVPGEGNSLGNAYERNHVEEWIKISENDITTGKEDGTYTPYDWDTFFDIEHGTYRSGCDSPLRVFVKELADYYPSAKIILTQRNGKSWYNSITKAWCRFASHDSMTNWYDKLLYWYRGSAYYKLFPDGKTEQKFRDMLTALDSRESRILGGIYLKTYSVGRICSDEEYAIRYMNVWNNYVQSVIPKERLLIINVEDSNEVKASKLIEFLKDDFHISQDVIDKFTYPHSNTHVDFENGAVFFKTITALLSLFPPIILLLIVRRFMTSRTQSTTGGGKKSKQS